MFPSAPSHPVVAPRVPRLIPLTWLTRSGFWTSERHPKPADRAALEWQRAALADPRGPMVEGVGEARKLGVAVVGRHLPTRTTPKHAIKRVDRFLSSAYFDHREAQEELLRTVIGPRRFVRIAVDWTKVPVEVLSERATVELEFYDATTWLEAWDSGEAGAHRAHVPVAVRTTVKVGDDDSGSVELVSTVVLPTIATSGDLRRPPGGTDE